VNRFYKFRMPAGFLSKKGRWFVSLALVVIGVCHGFFAVPLPAEPPAPEVGEGTAPKAPIHVTADKLESVHSQGYVDFTGNVKATQADVVMTANRMRVFYELGKDSGQEQGTISRVVSEGQVKIVFDKGMKTAEAEKATYEADQQVLILSGGDAKVWSGKNVVQGSKITLFYAEQRSVVEGAGQDQVEATLFVKEGDGLMK
jgi:lipopolysaccharide export system protein LptA